MKNILLKSLLLLDGLFSCVSAKSYDFKSGNIYYNITSQEDKTVEVAYPSKDYQSYSGSLVIPKMVANGDKTYLVTSIGQSAFNHCTSLSSVTIPNSVSIINAFAFIGCTSLTGVAIPNSVTSIGAKAFSECTGLKEIYNYSKTPQAITTVVFDNSDTTKCTLYVPIGSASKYKETEVWKDFINIQEFDTNQPERKP